MQPEREPNRNVAPFRRVILESPYASGTGLNGYIGRWFNRRYARKCVRDSLMRGEAPIASHLLYTQPGILRDSSQKERLWGIEAGLAWAEMAEATVIYVDRGVSNGMKFGIERATLAGKPVEYRTIRQHTAILGPYGVIVRRRTSPNGAEIKWNGQ